MGLHLGFSASCTAVAAAAENIKLVQTTRFDRLDWRARNEGGRGGVGRAKRTGCTIKRTREKKLYKMTPFKRTLSNLRCSVTVSSSIGSFSPSLYFSSVKESVGRK